MAIMGSPALNSTCALGLRNAIKDGSVRLLINEYDGDDSLMEIQSYYKLNASDKLDLKLPYINTTLLINELVNLEYETVNNVIKVKEKSGMRKDRYSSLSYNIYIAKQLERDLIGKNSRKSMRELALEFKAPVLNNNERRGVFVRR
jgi:hypothetical protein